MGVAERVSLDARSIADFIVDIEQRFPVDRWVLDGIEIWPLLRVQLYSKLWALVSPPVQIEARGRVKTIVARIVRQASIQWRGRLAEYADANHTFAETGRADVVLISDGISQMQVADGWFDRFCDPIAALAEARGKTTATFTLRDLFNVPRVRSGIFLQPKLERLKLLARARALRPGSGVGEVTQDIEKLNDILRHENSTLVFSPRLIGAQIVALRHASRELARRLVRCKAKATFIVDYYNLEGMAACHAAHSIGIPSVDLQHGVAGEHHSAYGRWTRVPARGYSVLPKIFWTWSAEDAACIEAWAKRTNGAHQARTVGNVFTVGWHGGIVPRPANLASRLHALKERQGDRSRYLVALQPGLVNREVLYPILKAIAHTRDAAHWWFRLHPLQRKGEREELHRLLNEVGGSVEIDEPTELPLLAILSESDALLTHSSSVVLEAESLGVPAIVWSPCGLDLFARSVKDGTAHAALDGEHICVLLKQLQDSGKRNFHNNAFQLAPLERALDEVLGR